MTCHRTIAHGGERFVLMPVGKGNGEQTMKRLLHIKAALALLPLQLEDAKRTRAGLPMATER